MSRMLFRLDDVTIGVMQDPKIPVNHVLIQRGMNVVLQNVEDDNVLHGEPRVDYARRYNVIPPDATEEQAVEIFRECWRNGRQTVGGSYDDAGHGSLSNKTAVLYGVRSEVEFMNWFNRYYPGVHLEFKPLPARREVRS